jgi:hypothetical protein
MLNPQKQSGQMLIFLIYGFFSLSKKEKIRKQGRNKKEKKGRKRKKEETKTEMYHPIKIRKNTSVKYKSTYSISRKVFSQRKSFSNSSYLLAGLHRKSYTRRENILIVIDRAYKDFQCFTFLLTRKFFLRNFP